MTEEQRKTVETIRGLMQSNRQWAVDTGGWIDNAEMLLEIIDDLQKQQPKRYTEGEIREACAVVFQMNENPSPVEKAFFESAVSNWLECARFLGMIKTEGESCRIRKRGDAHILTPLEFTEAHVDRYYLLEIVDSQAQKIAEQAKTIEINAAYAIELQGKLAEQAKEITEARGCAELMRERLEQAGAEGLIDNDTDLRLPWEKQ